jgi:hypothetical protein
VYPPEPVAVIAEVPEAPGLEIVTAAAARVYEPRSEASPKTPSDWGEPGALSVKLTDSAKPPKVVGEKVTLTVQPSLGAMETGRVPQLLVCVKSGPIEMPLSIRAAVPVFVIVNDWAGTAVPTVV